MLVPVPTDKETAAALAQPITKLIEVVSRAIGAIYTPVGTIVQAKADGIAAIIRAQSEVEVTDIQERALRRFVSVETERQRNLERIIQGAQEALPPTVSSKDVDNDWATHFFDCAKDVSNEDIGKVWSRILAGEIANPGATSRRALEALRTMDRDDAQLFSVVVWLSVLVGPWRYYIADRTGTFSVRSDGAECGTHPVFVKVTYGADGGKYSRSRTMSGRRLGRNSVGDLL